MKVYFNTKAFDSLPKKSQLDETIDIYEAELLVLGAKPEKYDELKKLKAIYRFGVGRENIPRELIDSGVPKVFFPSERTSDILFESTADFTTYLMFRMFYAGTEGAVDKWEKFTRNSISKKTLLVIGLGNIGKRVVAKMRPFVKITTYDIISNKPEDLRPLIENADIVSVHMSSTDQTLNFFDKEKLSWLKDDAILVNTARGKLFDEDALFGKLSKSGVRVAFDVFWQEPYQGKLKILGPEKFHMTPHVASQTIDYVEAGFKDILDIIKAFGGAK